MTTEIVRDFPSRRPPEWWHDAIRNNMEGSLYNENKFVTIPKPLVDEYSYSLVSLTALDPETKAQDGIYIETDIPEEKIDEMDAYKARIDQLLSEPFTKALHPTNEEDANIGVYFTPIIIKGNISYYCLPGEKKEEGVGGTDNPFAELEEALDGLRAKYFSNLNYVGRMKLLFDKNFPDTLKKRHLEIEIADNDALKRYYLRFGSVTRKALREIAGDKIRQKGYMNLLNRVKNSKTDEDLKMVEEIFESMSPKTHAGWIEFYVKYWERKFGPLY